MRWTEVQLATELVQFLALVFCLVDRCLDLAITATLGHSSKMFCAAIFSIWCNEEAIPSSATKKIQLRVERESQTMEKET